MGKLQCFAIFEDRTAGSRPSKSPSCKAKSAGALCCKIPACSTDWLSRWGWTASDQPARKWLLAKSNLMCFPHQPHFGWDYFPIFSHLQSLNTKTLVHTVRARDTSLKDSHAHLFHQLLSQKHLPFFHSGFCLYADHCLTQFFLPLQIPPHRSIWSEDAGEVGSISFPKTFNEGCSCSPLLAQILERR